MTKNWYDLNYSGIDTPALIIDKEKVKYNIHLAIELAKGEDRLRPHVKTHKTLEVAKMQLAEGIYKFKCATIAEAEMLGMAGAEEVLIAYPIQGPKINRVLSLQEKYSETEYSVLIDNLNTAKSIQDRAAEANQMLSVFIDINNGQNRTGTKIQKVENLVDTIQEFKNIELVGLHCYDGHIRMSSFDDRRRECQDAFSEVLELQSSLETKLQKELVMVAGGSPSFSVHAEHHQVECSPGTFIFWDQRYADDYEEQAFKKAAVVATRVISKLDAYTYCLDLGHKSIASEFPFPRVKIIHPNTFTQIGHSEEHLIIKSETPDVLSPGELLLAFPYHICPTVALYDHIHVANRGAINEQWAVIARNRKITI